MKEKWIELIKSVVLVILVTLSFVLTGFLWYSSPSYEEKSAEFVPPYVFNDERYNNKSIYQLVTPYQLILHHAGQTSWVLPENETYKELLESARDTSLSDVRPIQPTAEEWKKVYLATGMEFHFSRDPMISQLDTFFKETLYQQPHLKRLNKVSRVWFFSEPQTGQMMIWFISDQEKKVIQAKAEIKNLAVQIAEASNESTLSLVPVPVNNQFPWDEENDRTPFTRLLYLPVNPLPINQVIYNTGNIKEEAMIQWLFRSGELDPIILDNREHLYMFNDELLAYDKPGNYMVYTDTSSKAQMDLFTVTEEINQINNFVQFHRGWTGNYLLDDITQKDDSYLYQFRLFKQGYPIYWMDKEEGIYPDLIHLQTGSNGVSHYKRSMLYLSGDPAKISAKHLPGKEQLLQFLDKQKVDLATVERIYPGYQAKVISKGKQVQLDPVWVVWIEKRETPLFITSPS